MTKLESRQVLMFSLLIHKNASHKIQEKHYALLEQFITKLLLFLMNYLID